MIIKIDKPVKRAVFC